MNAQRTTHATKTFVLLVCGKKKKISRTKLFFIRSSTVGFVLTSIARSRLKSLTGHSRKRKIIPPGEFKHSRNTEPTECLLKLLARRLPSAFRSKSRFSLVFDSPNTSRKQETAKIFHYELKCENRPARVDLLNCSRHLLGF